MTRWIIGLALAGTALVVASSLAFVLGWGGGLAGGCRNTVVSTARSPDGRLDAVLFERNCGATTGFSTQVSIMSVGELPEVSGNIFVTDDDVPQGERGKWGGAWADVQWFSERRLHVVHAPAARLLKSLDRFGEVDITYGTAHAPRRSGSPH
ncbi:MAG: hypothetical protein Q7J28_05430 [Caulobacter sp.]|nr:hypothetical protein [Caulobacter sp.]